MALKGSTRGEEHELCTSSQSFQKALGSTLENIWTNCA